MAYSESILPDLFNGQYCTRYSPDTTRDIGISEQLIQWYRDGKPMIRQSALESGEDVFYTFSLKRKDGVTIPDAQVKEAQYALTELLQACGIKPKAISATCMEQALQMKMMLQASADEDVQHYESMYRQQAQRKAQGEVMLKFQIPSSHLPQLLDAMTDIKASVEKSASQTRGA